MLAKRPVFFATAFYTMGILAGANLRLPAFLHFLLGGVFGKKVMEDGWH